MLISPEDQQFAIYKILLENYYLPGQLEARLAEFVEYYNSRHYHESLDNLTPGRHHFS